MQTCPKCGTINRAGARFCGTCRTPLALQLGTILQNRYVLSRVLGAGGMGAVYQARDQRLNGMFVAIKEMLNSQIIDPHERQMAIAAFQREAQMLGTLKHPALPHVSDFFENAGRFYLVMEFIEGHNLEEVLTAQSGLPAEATVVNWVLQICEVLDYLHTRIPPVIFRDVKPTNIMLTPQALIKLIDFGIARFFQPGKAKDTVAYGTSGYAAPEQFGTGQTDARSDIYALGVTLHHLLTRYDPGQSPLYLPDARKLNPQISPRTNDVITRATKQNPSDRFQTAREMKQALQPQASSDAQTSSTDLISLWRDHKVKSAGVLRQTAKVWDVAFSPNQRYLAIAVQEATIVWDLTAQAEWRRLASASYLHRNVLFLDNLSIASGDYSHSYEIFDKFSSRCVNYKDKSSLPVKLCAPLDGSVKVVIKSTETSIVEVQDDAGKKLATIKHPGGVNGVDITADGKLVATAGNDGMVRLWEPEL